MLIHPLQDCGPREHFSLILRSITYSSVYHGSKQPWISEKCSFRIMAKYSLPLAELKKHLHITNLWVGSRKKSCPAEVYRHCSHFLLKTPKNLTTHANTISEAYLDADICYETSGIFNPRRSTHPTCNAHKIRLQLKLYVAIVCLVCDPESLPTI